MVHLRSGIKTENGTAETANGEKMVNNQEKKGNMTKVIFIGLLIDLLAFTLILPLFPALLDHYRKNDHTGLYPFLDGKVKSFQKMIGSPDQFNSVLFGGVLGSLFSLLQFVASPIIGGLSDLYGRRPLLLISTVGIAMSYAVWACASSFGIFVLARIFGGLAKGNVSLATAIVTDESTVKTRGKGMAMIGIAFSIGFLLGPIIGAGFSIWAKERTGNWYVYPAMCALTLSVTDLIFLYFFFEETLSEKQRLKSLSEALSQAACYINPVSLFQFASLKNLSNQDQKSLRTLGLVYFLYLFLYSGLEFTLTFLTHIRFDFTSMQQGKMFLFIGVLMAVVQGGFSRRIPAGKEKSVACLGLLLIIPSFAIIGFAYNIVTLYIGLALYALSTAVCVPCMTTMVSVYGDANQKGIVTGVFRSLGALGRALGPLFSCTVYWMVGPELCYCMGGIGLFLPYFLLKRS